MTLQLVLIVPAYSLAHYAARSIAPQALMLARLAGAALLLAPVFFALGGFHRFRLTRRQWLSVTFLSLLGIVLNQYLFVVGLKYTTPANSALIYALTPLVVLLSAVFLLRQERITAGKLGGILLALTGVVLLFLGKESTVALDRDYGNWLTLGAMCCWALYLVLSKRVVQGINPLQLTAAIMVIGFLVYLPFGVQPTLAFDWGTVPRLAWVGLGSLILVNSVASYLLINYAFGALKASQVATYINLHPLGAAVFSYFALGERFTPAFVVGALCTVVGIFWLNRAQAAIDRQRRLASLQAAATPTPAPAPVAKVPA